MRVQFRCQRPECGKKFGLVRKYAERWTGFRFRNFQYCSDHCKRAHTAELTAQSVKQKRWLDFLKA